MRGRRRRHEDDHENIDRWLVSYADFITLLFAFFVVMYSMSSINEGKYRVLSDTLLEAFKTPPKSADPIQVGEPKKSLDPVEPVLEKPDVVSLKPEPAVDTGQTARIAQRLQQSLKTLVDRGLIKIKHDKLWVEVELNNRILFASGEAELQPSAYPVLRQLARELKDMPNHIDVEGHTDNLPIRTEVFRSNWELSAARAASVVHLLTREGVDPARLSAIGYGEFRPIADNRTAEGRRRNRRVAIIILADKHARRMLEIERHGRNTPSAPPSP